MLGLIGSARQWKWAAYGKHPVANDYLRLGKKFPLMGLLVDWVDKGYPAVATEESALHGRGSWRFWARGSGKEDLVCGMIRNSSDSMGRPYPLLIMGTGPLKDWDDHWDLLPLAFEKTWGQMEYLSARVLSEVHELETEVQNIRQPHPEWPEFKEKRLTVVDIDTSPGHESSIPHFRELNEQARRFSAQAESFIHLHQGETHDEVTLILLWHFLFKSSGRKIPNAVFAGGTVERTCLAWFNRPLNPADFVYLWSLPSEGSEGKQRDV